MIKTQSGKQNQHTDSIFPFLYPTSIYKVHLDHIHPNGNFITTPPLLMNPAANQPQSEESNKEKEENNPPPKKKSFKTKFLRKKVLHLRRNNKEKGLVKKVEEVEEDSQFESYDLAQMFADANRMMAERQEKELREKEEREAQKIKPPIQPKLFMNKMMRAQLVLNQYHFCTGLASRKSAFALGVRLLDLYSQINVIPHNDAVFIALGCLTIAMKLENTGEEKRIPYNDIFPMYKFYEAETQILKTLKYKIYHKTYFTHIQDLIDSWDKYCQSLGKLQLRFYREQNPALTLSLISSLVDKLDCINIVKSTNRFSSKNTCLNLFFLDTLQKKKKLEGIREDDDVVERVQKAYQDRDHLQAFGEFQEYMKKNFQEREINAAILSLKSGLFLAPFLKVEENEVVPHPLRSLNDNILLMKSSPSVLKISQEILNQKAARRE